MNLENIMWNKPVIKDHVMYGCIYMKRSELKICREQKQISNHRRRLWQGWEVGGNEEWLLMCIQCLSGCWKCFKIRLGWWLYYSVRILKPAKLYTLNRWILWYMRDLKKAVKMYLFMYSNWNTGRLQRLIWRKKRLMFCGPASPVLLNQGIPAQWRVTNNVTFTE